MTNTTLCAEIKILMPFFNIPVSEFQNLVKLHGSVEALHSHLGNLFDNRKALKN